MYNFDGLTVIEHSTVTGNTAPADFGGGVASYGDTYTSTQVRASVIAANTGTDVDFVFDATNSFDSDGDNLIGDGNATGAFTLGGDQTGVADPGLGPLADNGGPTLTHALVPGSLAIDAVTATCPPPATDQRGVERPQPAGGNCDIGSFEIMAAPSPDLAVSKTDSPDPVVVTDHLTYTVTVNNAGAGDATGVTLSDSLPSSVTFVSASAGCAETVVDVVVCDLPDLASGAMATVTIVVRPTETGTITNRVTVTSVVTDDNPGNNSDSEATTVSELLCNGLVPTIVGTPGNDANLRGTNGPDVIHGLGGNDSISGLNANDVICGGEDNDTLSGNNGIDQLFGENGTDTLNGNNGADALDGGTGTDTCNGGNGSDTGTACETQTSIP